MLPVLEIFHSIDGEGIRTGELATFVRLKGCNLHCVFCDTAYSIPMNDKGVTKMEVNEIVANCKYHNVTITGGEPLIHSETMQLVEELILAGHHVNIETNGTKDTTTHFPNMFYTVDYKTIYSGHSGEMNPSAFSNLTANDVVKVVAANREDLEDAYNWFTKFYGHLAPIERPWLYISPVFGKIEPSELVDWVKEKNLDCKTRVQVQLHKIIWNPNERMV